MPHENASSQGRLRYVLAIPCAVLVLLLATSSLHAALAKLSGGSGYSADLSKNVAVRHQQLICDPTLGDGSASVSYDPSVVSLYSIFNQANYSLNGAYIGVIINGQNAIEQNDDYFANPLPQWGYVQVAWNTSTAGSMTQSYGPGGTPSGFTLEDSAGPAGANTFGLEFDYLPSSNTVVADYTVFAASGTVAYPFYSQGVLDGTYSPQDTISDSDGNVIPYNQIAPASVSGDLGAPEPSASLPIAATVIAGLLWRGRRERRGPSPKSVGLQALEPVLISDPPMPSYTASCPSGGIAQTRRRGFVRSSTDVPAAGSR
jgi:hypothetical protein